MEDQTTDIQREFGELIQNFQTQFEKFLDSYRAQVISDYIDQQHEDSVSVQTQTPVTDDGTHLLVAGRKAKVIRLKMQNFREDLTKVKTLQEGSCLTNYYRKLCEDMEKELHLDSLELEALEAEMNMNGTSFEVDRVTKFYDEMNEECLHQPQDNLPDHYIISLRIQQKLQNEIQEKIQNDKDCKAESPENDQEKSPKADSAKRKKVSKEKIGDQNQDFQPKTGNF